MSDNGIYKGKGFMQIASEVLDIRKGKGGLLVATIKKGKA